MAKNIKQEEVRKKAEELFWNFDANENYCCNCIDSMIEYLEENALNIDNEHVEFWEAVRKDIKENSNNFV